MSARPRAPTPDPAGARLQGLPPLVGPGTRLLVLGSFPGAASLAGQQYYGHPQNHFWKILSVLWALPLLELCYEKRSDQLLDHGLGLWDVYASCERQGSLDAAIRAARLNDLAGLGARCPQLCGVAHNGAESFRHARHSAVLGVPVWRLPSTSPANASWSFERKLAAWREVLQACGVPVRG